MPIFSASTLGSALAAFIILTPAVVVGAEDPQPYDSATEAYRQGATAMKTGEMSAAVPALEYAAKRGVLGAQLKLARLYAVGRRDVPRDDAKAFYYYQHIADQYAEIPSSSPIAKYVGEAFVALGRYYVGGIPDMALSPDPVYAVGLYRHAGAYFGNAEAQYQLGRLYLDGGGVEKNPTIAANWLAMAARKQHASAQAILGELLWRGEDVSRRQARGLAFLTLANENAKASEHEPEWIGPLYQDAFAHADNTTRKQAEVLLPRLGGAKRAAAIAAKATHAVDKPAQSETALTAVDEPQLGPVDVLPPAAMGLSVGFGAPGDGLGGVRP